MTKARELEGASAPILHFEPINWHRVADCLEQQSTEYAKRALAAPLASSARTSYSTSALVLLALRDAIREGLE